MIAVDSITRLLGRADDVVVAGSHGGLYAAHLAALLRVRGVIFNDAGVGLDGAGIAGLKYLDSLDVPAAAVGFRTARIGDAADSLRRGRLTHVNAVAGSLGCRPGMSCAAAAALMKSAPPMRARAAVMTEARGLVSPGAICVWALDSASLTRPSDAGHVLVTGSHGALLGGRPDEALHVDALAAVYNDAGGGIDDAGYTRLAALEARGIAAATVGHDTARIGEARSTWESGVVSAVNATAAASGARPGMGTADWCGQVIRRAQPAAGEGAGAR